MRVAFLGAVLAASAAHAQAVMVLQQTGRLLNGEDTPLTGSVQLTFSIYKAENAHEGEVQEWRATYSVDVFNGVYSVELGKTGGDPLSSALFPSNEPRYLAVKVGTDGEMSPRMKIGMVPTAMNALRLGGKAPEDYVLNAAFTTSQAAQDAAVAAAIDALGPADVGAEPADPDLQLHLAAANNPHGVTVAQIGAEPANANIQAHIANTSNPHNVSAAQVGLGNVENVALSTWAGSTSLTTIGTLANGAVPTARITGALTDGTSADTLHRHASLKDGTGTLLSADSQGNILIGLAAPGQAKLDVGGAIRFAGGSSGACGSANAGAVRWSGTAFEGCDGFAWVRLNPPGLTQQTAGANCKRIKLAYPQSVDGVYWIDPDAGSTANAVQIYCDMTFDGGGWTTIANTRKPDNDNVVKLTAPHSDMQQRDPYTKNLAIYRWAGEAWTEFLVECRTPSPGDAPVRWIFVKSAQPSIVQTGMNDIIVNGNNAAVAFTSAGNNVCPVKNDPGRTYYCGHNNNGSESEWGDGFQIGLTNPTWSGLLFASTDSQNQKKCSAYSSYDYTSGSGTVPSTAIYTYRIR
jgi:hypothetical protein